MISELWKRGTFSKQRTSTPDPTKPGAPVWGPQDGIWVFTTDLENLGPTSSQHKRNQCAIVFQASF